MKTAKLLISLTIALLFNGVVAAFLAPVVGLPVEGVFLALTGLSLIPMPSGVAVMAIQKEIWINDIVGNLFKANPHLAHAMNADQFVLQGKVVHIPNAGTKPNVEKNRSTLPATVVQRTDIDITFPLDEFTSDPILIPNADKYELSYDKRMSVISEQASALAEIVGDWFFRYWAASAAANIVRTSGGATAAHYGTGNRALITLTDVKNIQKLFNKNNIPQEGRIAALDADMMDQFTEGLNVSQYRDFSAAYDASNGVLGKLYSFTFLDPRSTVLYYTNATVPVVKDPGSAAADTDNGAALFWHKDSVIRALGNNEMFEKIGDPTFYGDIYSVLVRAGGRVRRSDGRGVIALVQGSII